MAVDDNPANLKLLENMLRQYGYEVRSFPRGRLALSGAGQEPPDLILLDINMPEMNGYQVCEELKSTPSLSGIPVIFLSALHAVEDKVKGFKAGGVDYISKPFQFEEVQARVETHLALRRAQKAERDLLEGTLGGAVEAIWELIQLTSPLLALRSRAIRDIVRWMIKGMRTNDLWQFELASMLCLMGCVALPEDIVERAYCGQSLTPEEGRMFRAHPETGARLLSKIPRMESVAEMIRTQLKPEREPAAELSTQGAHMLHLALELDRRIYQGMLTGDALEELRLSGRFDTVLLRALATYRPPHAGFEGRRLTIHELRHGMILTHDVFTGDGHMLILKEGTVLDDTWIDRLLNFSKSRGVQEPLDVRVPG